MYYFIILSAVDFIQTLIVELRLTIDLCDERLAWCVSEIISSITVIPYKNGDFEDRYARAQLQHDLNSCVKRNVFDVGERENCRQTSV